MIFLGLIKKFFCYKRLIASFSIVFSIVILSSTLSHAADVGLEKEFQIALEQSKLIINRAKEKLKTGAAITTEISQLKALSEGIKASHLLFQDRFSLREKRAQGLGVKAFERHAAMSENYQKAIEEYLILIDSLPAESKQQTADSIQQILNNLETLLNKILPKKKRPIHGSLPYKRLNYPSKEPNAEPSIIPAYKGGNKTVSPDDLKGTTIEAPISKEIANLAQSLNWNPVLIYEYVKNNVDTEWYWGCMKGAEETLRQKSGNDCDQAALLIALLRASGFPSRYVRGVIEFFPDIEKAKNLTGINDRIKIAEFFQKAGIPFKPIISGGGITNLQIEHIWVESQIPYANYRGAILDEYGKTWLGLDTSIKAAGYQYNNSTDIFQQSAISGQLSAIRDEYLSTIQTQTPLEYLKVKLSAISGQPADSYKLTRSLIPEIMNILPASMQFTQIKITNEYTGLPDELRHKVRIIASRQDTADSIQENLFDITLDAFKLSNQRIAISYEPETVEDQEIINSYGGLDNTPSYLIRLRPVLKVNGERIIVGADGLPMGAEYNLTIELMSPNGTESITNTHIAGNLSVIGVVAQKAISVQQSVESSKQTAEGLLYEEAMNYINRWNQAEDELSSLTQLAITRPMPTVVTIGGVIDVTYLLDSPHGFEWKGVFVDADFRTIETVDSRQDTADRGKTFVQLSALQGSVLENRIFEDDFKVDSISTAKLFSIANSRQNTADRVEILTIDKTNIDAILPTLSLDENIKDDIKNAVNQGFELKTLNSELVFNDWTGVGYIKENIETGEAGYMLSGMIAGGMTAWGLDKWPETLSDILSNPFTSPANYDPVSARLIEKIPDTDFQSGEAGSELNKTLQVKVRDKEGKEVKGAEVVFKVIAGGGKLIDTKNNNAEADDLTVATNSEGIAEVKFKLGKETKTNPTFMKLKTDDKYYTQIGENIIEASLATTATKTTTPFTAFGLPGEPRSIKKLYGDNGIEKWGAILTFSGFISAAVVDKNENPISNLPVRFESLDAQQNQDPPNCINPYTDTRTKALLYTAEACQNYSPLYGDCSDATKTQIDKATSPTGVQAQVILGGIPDAIYPIDATCTDPKCTSLETGGQLKETFRLYSYYHDDCNITDDPKNQLFITYSYLKDQNGNNINAGKVGAEIPLKTRMFYLKEEGIETERTLTCESGAITCPAITGNRLYTTTTAFTDAKVTLQGTDAPWKAEANGIFTSNYTLLPGKNTITINGEGSIGIKKSGDCAACSITDDTLTQNAFTIMDVYGVDIPVETPLPVLIDNIDANGNGYSLNNLTIKYTINPADYKAFSAYVALLEEDEIINIIPSEKTGAGTAVFAQGFQFNLNKKYEVQIILNYGTGVEIRSEKAELKIVRMAVVNQLGQEIAIDEKVDGNVKKVEELKYSDGTNTTKRYRIKIELGSLFGKIQCRQIEAKATIMKKDGNNITIPEGEYPKDTTNLLFDDSGILTGTCLSKVDDTLSAFALTNLSMEALGDAKNEILPLYGGIGNKFRIEFTKGLTGAKKDIKIEPVGVIVIGIDGLRQDVLYPQKLDKVNDGGQYRIDISSLIGLRQILAGYDQTDENKQRYKMLPEVTAIFPSITFASWASIFTGKFPKETGIMGNEYFARDLYASNITFEGLRSSPPGMITYSDGAFKVGCGYGFPLEFYNEACFYSTYIIPGDWHDDTYKENSIPNRTLLAKTVYEEVAPLITGYQVSSDKSIKCDASSNECRSVVVYNHYAEGADRWRTMSNPIKSVWDYVSGGLAYLMDSTPSGEAVDFIDSYFSNKNPDGNRKRFPALFTVYFAGLDHEAHDNGMGVYKDFFTGTTDPAVKKVVDKLKLFDEFDNKIFIITADHGMTEMPEFGTVTLYPGTEDERDVTPDTSCKLKVDGFNKRNVQDSEKANNNLHIWEMGNLFTQFPSPYPEVELKVLAPEEIAKVLDGATNDIDEANVIAALNGPMAHIYIKGADWQSDPAPQLLDLVLNRIYGVLKEGSTATGGFGEKIQKHFPRISSSIDGILIRRTLNSEYEVYAGDLNNTLYVDAVKRINGMNHKDRSGDIVLIMKDATSGNATDRYTTGVACKSWHGSLNPSDSYVPLIVAYPGGNKKEIEKILQKDTLCKADYSECKENRKTKDLITEIIKTQYPEQ